MDSIRLSQVNEALNYDKNINAMVFNLEKKRTAMFPDTEVLPYSQIGEETMTTTKEGANSLKVLLDAKLATVAQLNRSVGMRQQLTTLDRFSQWCKPTNKWLPRSSPHNSPNKQRTPF
jgi:hypothetical protein